MTPQHHFRELRMRLVEVRAQLRAAKDQAELTETAVNLDLEIELTKPLDQMTREELIQHGGNLKAAIDAASVPGRVPSEPLPMKGAKKPRERVQGDEVFPEPVAA